jgi:hypothetical protein
MSAPAQQAAAVQALAVIQDFVRSGQLINGYGTLAELCGREGGSTDARFFGQVTSRIDAACFYAGLPMLSAHWVRNSLGEVNPFSFDQDFAPFKDEILRVSAGHIWTDEDFSRLLKHLHQLPDEAATTIWDHIRDREYAKPGFIKYNLHRRLSANQANG